MIFVVTAVILPLLLSEFGDWCPWLGRRLVRWSARRLGDPVACARYEEEWLANLAEIPGKLSVLVAAFGLLGCVPRMRWIIVRARHRAATTALSHDPTAVRIDGSTLSMDFAHDLLPVRSFVAEHAARLGLATERVPEFTLVANELALNAVVHGAGYGEVRLWRDEHHVFCEISDPGRLLESHSRGASRPEADFAVGWTGPPGRRRAPNGHGLWLVRTLADRFEIHSGPSGTTVRAGMPRISPSARP